jgi:hypothetical protein
MVDQDHQSFVQIGDYDISFARNPKSLIWIDMIDSYFWSTESSGYRVGTSNTFENGFPSEFTTKPLPVIFDTGTSLSYLPACKIKFKYNLFIAIGASVISQITRGTRYAKINNLYYINCDRSKYQSLFILVQEEYWLELPPDTFILEVRLFHACSS